MSRIPPSWSEPDLGAAGERTALAWQRTALSMSVTAAVIARLTWDVLGPATVVLLILVVGLSIWVGLHSGRRYAARKDDHRRRNVVGRAAAAVTTGVVVACTMELLSIAAR